MNWRGHLLLCLLRKQKFMPWCPSRILRAACMVGCCILSPGVPRRKVSLLWTGKDVLLPPVLPSATHRTSLALKDGFPLSFHHSLFPSLSKQDLSGYLNTHSYGIKIFMDNLNNYLNYTRHSDLGVVLTLCLPFLAFGSYPWEIWLFAPRPRILQMTLLIF